jgi:hypothetical protein
MGAIEAIGTASYPLCRRISGRSDQVWARERRSQDREVRSSASPKPPPIEYDAHGRPLFLLGAEEGGAHTAMDPYDLPFLGATTEAGAMAVGVQADLRAADGIILGSPEIHGSISGVLKNARPHGPRPVPEMLGLIGSPATHGAGRR